MLSSLKGIEKMITLPINELDLSNNLITSSVELERLKGFKELKTLIVMGNTVDVTE